MTIDTTTRIAKFRNIEHGFESVFALDTDSTRGDDWTVPGYARLSEWVDVSFPPLNDEKVIAAALATIAETRASVVREFTRKLAKIDEQAANFRSISAPVSP